MMYCLYYCTSVLDRWKFFGPTYVITVVPFDLKRRNFAWQVRKCLFPKVRDPTPMLRGRLDGAPACSTSAGPPTCVHTVGDIVTKFRTVIKLDEWEIFTRSTTPMSPTTWRKVFVTRILTSDMFAVANFLFDVNLHTYANHQKVDEKALRGDANTARWL